MLKYETFPVQNDPRQPAVDSSTTLLLNNPSPTLLCAWSGGSSEGAPDTKIYLSRCEEGFDTYEYKWGSSEVIAEEEGQAHWTPILFKLPQSDEATLFYKVGPNPTEWHTRVKTSSDGGKTWSESRELVPGDIGMSPITLHTQYTRLTTSDTQAAAALQKTLLSSSKMAQSSLAAPSNPPQTPGAASPICPRTTAKPGPAATSSTLTRMSSSAKAPRSLPLSISRVDTS